ncbi:MAG: hypothetical protein PHO76_09240 [Methylotenera sp.]|nr:hypothetical protein [Methylotenera sp.]MDD4925945.1 hypothetical protein [Methylotenera sp.]
MIKIRSTLVGITVFILCGSISAEEIGQVTKIDVPDKEVSLYSQGTGWDISKKLPVEKIKMPLPIKEKSAMRYKVLIEDQEAWLDRNDVMADLVLTVPGDCEPPRKTAAASAATRGLGEPCKSEPPKAAAGNSKNSTPSPTKPNKGAKKK